jgi:hypothetical protein
LSSVVGRYRRYLFAALAVASIAQVLFTVGGRAVPDRSDLYGAPFPVGESGGLNVLFTAGFGSFSFPIWILNVLVTALVLLVAAVIVDGRTTAGLITACLAVVAAYVIVLILPGSEDRSNQLVVWVWMLAAVTAVWAIIRFRRGSVERIGIGRS